MKKNLYIVAIILSVLAVITFASCDVIEAQGLMEDFVDDVNDQNWSSLQQYTHSDASDYLAGGSGTFWSGIFDIYRPLDLIVTTDSAATVEGDDGTMFYFTLEDDGGDMKISGILRGSTTVFD